MKSRGIWLTVVVVAVVGAMILVPSCRCMQPAVDRSKEEWRAVQRLRAFLNAQGIFKIAGLAAKVDPQKEGWYAASLEQLVVKDESVELPALDFVEATSPEKAVGGYYFVLGPCGKDQFSLYAVSAKYGGSCIKTFYVDHQRDILEKDLKGLPPTADRQPSVEDGWDRSVIAVK